MAEITREKISAIRAYYIGPHKEALRYMVISDILYDALPALLDIAEANLARKGGGESAATIRNAVLREAAAVCSAYSDWATEKINEGRGDLFGIVGNTADDCAERILALIQPKGGDANADPTGSNSSTKSIPATSPGVTAWASEIDELCKRLLNFRRENGTLSGAECQLTMEAATLIRRLERERDQWKELASETQEDLQVIGEDFGAHGGERRTDAMRRLLTDATASATAAEEEVARLRAENSELKAWKKRRQEEDEDEADRREIW